MTYLKPCPHCGANASLLNYSGGYQDPHTSICCSACPSSIVVHDKNDSEQLAIEAWNKRHGEETLAYLQAKWESLSGAAELLNAAINYRDARSRRIDVSTDTEFKRGARAMFDSLMMLVANNWDGNAETNEQCKRYNSFVTELATKSLQEVVPNDSSNESKST